MLTYIVLSISYV